MKQESTAPKADTNAVRELLWQHKLKPSFFSLLSSSSQKQLKNSVYLEILWQQSYFGAGMLNELANAKTTASGEGNHMIQLAIKRDEFISSSQGKTDLKFPIIFEILQSKNRQKKTRRRLLNQAFLGRESSSRALLISWPLSSYITYIYSRSSKSNTSLIRKPCKYHLSNIYFCWVSSRVGLLNVYQEAFCFSCNSARSVICQYGNPVT